MAVTAKFELALLRQRDQLLQRVGRHRRMHDEQVRRVGQHASTPRRSFEGSKGSLL
jgi:hypothetical protein